MTAQPAQPAHVPLLITLGRLRPSSLDCSPGWVGSPAERAALNALRRLTRQIYGTHGEKLVTQARVESWPDPEPGWPRQVSVQLKSPQNYQMIVVIALKESVAAHDDEFTELEMRPEEHQALRAWCAHLRVLGEDPQETCSWTLTAGGRRSAL